MEKTIDRYQKHTKGISIDNEAPEENPQVTPLFLLSIYELSSR